MWPHLHQTDGFFAALWTRKKLKACQVRAGEVNLAVIRVNSRGTATPAKLRMLALEFRMPTQSGSVVSPEEELNMLLPDWAVLNASLIGWAHGLWNLTWWQIVLYTLVTTHITIAAVTIFLHRAQAHRALELHAIPSHFFRFWLWWARACRPRNGWPFTASTTPSAKRRDDPHSPQTRGLDTVMWRGAELYRAEAKNPETLAESLATAPPMTGWSATCTAALAGRVWA
jgi:hypothetical protein